MPRPINFLLHVDRVDCLLDRTCTIDFHNLWPVTDEPGRDALCCDDLCPDDLDRDDELGRDDYFGHDDLDRDDELGRDDNDREVDLRKEV